MHDRGHALTPIPEAPDAPLPFRCAASKPPDHWHDSGEMASVRAPVESMVDIEPFRDSSSDLDDLLREYIDDEENGPAVLP